jgi:hypothetical protein
MISLRRYSLIWKIFLEFDDDHASSDTYGLILLELSSTHPQFPVSVALAVLGAHAVGYDGHQPISYELSRMNLKCS